MSESEAQLAEPQAPSPLEKIEGLASRRHFIIGAAMAGAMTLAEMRMPQLSRPRIDKAAFERWVPDLVGPWRFLTKSGVVLPPPDALSDRLYDNLVSRVYEADNKPTVMVALAYNNIQSGVLQVHRPETCYPAGGYALSPTRQVEISTLNRAIFGNFFTATGYNRTEQVMYWTRVGNEFPTSWARQRLAVIHANLTRQIPDGMLARFSVLSEDSHESLSLLNDFVRLFEAASAPTLRQLLLG